MLGIDRNYEARKLTIPEMIFNREQFGINSQHQNKRVTVSDLSYHVAWNPTRMQNMTLSVGPGTPASVCMVKLKKSDSLSDENGSGEESEIEDQEHSYSDEDDGSVVESEDIYVNVEESSESDNSIRREDDSEVRNIRRSQDVAERPLMEWMEADDIESEEDEERSISSKMKNAPSIRHSGCINTSTWLTSPWRLSSCGHDIDNINTQHSQDCPTQLITSGDDRMVKFWDLRYAMGMSNPLPGGKNTICPFSTEVPSKPPSNEWEKYYSNSSTFISGSVIPLATLATGHRGNVFHVTPLDNEPGKVVTCGADGYLRCSDLSSQSSSVVISPEYDRHDQNLFLSPGGLFSLRPGMCFSHHFIDAHNGLLCSERGLRRFDLRVNPREQQSSAVLSSDTCKACAIWSRDSVNSSYVFVGGASPDVALYDLRMLSDGGVATSKVVQLYRPRYLHENASVSVSGIDISRNKRELLISYENDQIYSFPICPSARTAGPTVDDLDKLIKETEERGSIQRELCSYGGHLNRYTFLKNARYAGPNDDYICTGSDSGHAWIYKKDTGAVVSFLNADHSTCNGVVPHPTLPFFVTYGIDSTAKLWRATIPVNGDVDDSPLGRSQFNHRKSCYVNSPLITDWLYCKERLIELCDLDENNSICVMPDEIPMPSAISGAGVFGRIYHSRVGDQERNFIGNDLQSLPRVLRENLFSCIVALENDDDEPVRSGINELKRRISTIRLHFEANKKGLINHPGIPWQMKARTKYIGIKTLSGSNCMANEDTSVEYGDPADLVPENPCDWIPFDPDMIDHPLECGLNFNLEDYECFFLENYKPNFRSSINDDEGGHPKQASPPQRNKRKLDSQDPSEMDIICNKSKLNIITPPPSQDKKLSGSIEKLDSNNYNAKGLQIIHDTVTLLKEAGNKALKAGFPALAAQRYDKAIQYCAVIYLKFPAENPNIFFDQNIDPNLEWTPLLQLLITTRLNLSMVCLKITEPDPKKAIKLALLALDELGPFTEERGKIRKGPKLSKIHKEDEAGSTYETTKGLQAKAYFRLGSAQLAIKDFSGAVQSFEESLKSTKAIGEDSKPEQVVFRRLAEAKRENARKEKKRRNRFSAAFNDDDKAQKEMEENIIPNSNTVDKRET